jgi:hypothetical protein
VTGIYNVKASTADIPTDCRHLLPRLTVVATDTSPAFLAHNSESIVAFAAPADASLTKAQRLAVRSDAAYSSSCDVHAFSAAPLLFVWRGHKPGPKQFPSAVLNPEKQKGGQPQLGLMHQLGESNPFRPGDFVALSAELLVTVVNIDTASESRSKNAAEELAAFLNRLPGEIFRFGEKHALACEVFPPSFQDPLQPSNMAAKAARFVAPPRTGSALGALSGRCHCGQQPA